MLGWLFLYIPRTDASINEQYFKLVIKLSHAIESPEFQNQVNGFYLSKYNNKIRFSFFTNQNETVDFLKEFFVRNEFTFANNIQLPKVEKFDQYCRINKSNIDFRRYLQLITNIGLDLIKYDVLYARKVVAKYRLEIIPENKDVKVYFDKVLQKSKYYKSLPQDIKNEVLSGLSFWIDDYNDWAHMLVVMLLPEDLDKAVFDPRKILNTKQKNDIIEYIFNDKVTLDI